MEENYKSFTIGQFANMHGINKKTLMWYDEIGLFKPADIDSENGYRRYNYMQSSMLETILLLRELDLPINEIQNFMKNRSAESLEILLKDKISELDKKIAHLKELKNTVLNHHRNMTTLMTMNLHEITIVEKEKRSLITVDISGDISFDKEVETVMAETRAAGLRRLHDASYGTMISAEDLYKGKFNNYSKLFIDMPFPVKQEGLHLQRGGKYLRAFYKGAWEGLPLKYQEILDYAKKHGLKLTGFSYETGINENVIDKIEDYVTQIEIPVCV